MKEKFENLFENKKKFSKEDAEKLAKEQGYKGDMQEFAWGLDIELEHGTITPDTNVTDDDPTMTAKIALAHLNEIPDYYTRLRQLEKEGKAALKKNVNEMSDKEILDAMDKKHEENIKYKLSTGEELDKYEKTYFIAHMDKFTNLQAEATHGEVPFDTFDKKPLGNKIEEAIEEGRLVTYTTKILSDMSKIPGLKRIGAYSVADGTVGLFRYEDGNAYEIEIRPAALAKRKDVWGNLLKKREDR